MKKHIAILTKLAHFAAILKITYPQCNVIVVRTPPVAEMYVEIVAGARRFVDKCAMNKATELTLNGRDKVSDRPNCSANLAYTVHAR